MSDLKISQLTALTGITADAADILPVVDISATTTKKISLSELVEFIVGSDAFSGAVGAMAPAVSFDDAENIIVNAVFS